MLRDDEVHECRHGVCHDRCCTDDPNPCGWCLDEARPIAIAPLLRDVQRDLRILMGAPGLDEGDRHNLLARAERSLTLAADQLAALGGLVAALRQGVLQDVAMLVALVDHAPAADRSEPGQ
jgi:hypothetical protein